MSRTITITLNDQEAEGLAPVLARLYTWVNYGAGVDAWLADDILLLAPDDFDANSGLHKIITSLDPNIIRRMEAYWEDVRKQNVTK